MTTDEIIIIICAFRYALGRRTYVVSVIANRLIQLYPKYPLDQQRRTAKEIKEAIEKGNAGHEMAVEQWKKVMCLFTPELHFKGKAYYAVESRIEEVGKEYPLLKLSDKFDEVETVLVDGVYYALDMKKHYHSFIPNLT
jgi:hypothetical protein